MKSIIAFYQNSGSDSEHRYLEDIWTMTDEQIMHSHDIIQWLFPIDEKSAFNPSAPVLTVDHIKVFQRNPLITENLRTSFNRFLQVVGLQYEDGVVSGNPDMWVFKTQNHNWLRFTRILRCLTLANLQKEANAFWAFLAVNAGDEVSRKFWEDALNPSTKNAVPAM